MTHSGIINLDPHLVSPGRGDLDVLNAQILASVPGHCGPAGNCLGNFVSFHTSRRLARLGQYAYLSDSRRHIPVQNARVDIMVSWASARSVMR